MLTSYQQSLALVTRLDDAGLCESVNEATLDAASSGLVRNVSIMVPGPAFAHAAEPLRDRADLCLGLHVTLNSEWERVRCGPLSPPSEVPSLIDEDGYFLPFPKDFHDRESCASEMMKEIRRQLDAARMAGLDIRYVDEHMGVSWVCGLRERLADFILSEGLVDAHSIPTFPPGLLPVEECAKKIHTSTPGIFALVSHVGFNRDDLRRCQLRGQADGVVATERDAERRAWHDIRLHDAIYSHRVALLRYDEIDGQ